MYEHLVGREVPAQVSINGRRCTALCERSLFVDSEAHLSFRFWHVLRFRIESFSVTLLPSNSWKSVVRRSRIEMSLKYSALLSCLALGFIALTTSVVPGQLRPQYHPHQRMGWNKIDTVQRRGWPAVNPALAERSFSPSRGTQNAFDSTFGKMGVVDATPPGSLSAIIWEVASQPDGKILAYGYPQNPPGPPFIERFLPDGSLDRSFGGTGIVVPDTGVDTGFQSMAVQRDGKILLGGTVFGDTHRIWLSRLTPSGAKDVRFGTLGNTMVDLDNFDIFGFTRVTVQPDGKIVAATTRTAGTVNLPNNNLVVMRFTSTGKLDRLFGSNGIAEFDFGTDENCVDISALRDGRIIIAGNAFGISSLKPFVLRLQNSGLADPSFGTSGVAFFGDANPAGLAFTMAVLPNGQPVISGDYYDGVGLPSYVARLTTSGLLDPTFGDGGFYVNDGQSSIYDIALQSDGSIVASGGYVPFFDVPETAFVTRIASSGQLDSSFGDNGMVLHVPDSVATCVLVQPSDRKIVFGGMGPYGIDSPAFVARLLN